VNPVPKLEEEEEEGLSRSLQERSLDIGRALKSETLVQSSLEDCRTIVEQFNRQ